MSFPASQMTTSGARAATNLHDHVIWQLGCDIVAGNLPAGSLLPPDAELMQTYSISRTVVREALKTLRAKGLVDPKPSVGTRVLSADNWNMFDKDVLAWHIATGPSSAFLEQITEIRGTIEPETAALAAIRRSDQQALSILGWAERMANSFGDAAAFARADLEFHRTIAEASGNRFMRSIAAIVETALTAIFTLSSPVEDYRAFDETVSIHRDIAKAIEAGAPDLARVAMATAIRSGYERSEKVSNLR